MSLAVLSGEDLAGLGDVPADDTREESALLEVDPHHTGECSDNAVPQAGGISEEGDALRLSSVPEYPGSQLEYHPSWPAAGLSSEWRRSSSNKRARLRQSPSEHNHDNNSTERENIPSRASTSPSPDSLFGMPRDLLVSSLLSRVDGASLARLECTCRGLSQLVEDAANAACLQGYTLHTPPSRMYW
jgi:hypothetical protein